MDQINYCQINYGWSARWCLPSSKRWTNQYHDISSNKQHSNLSGLFPHNFFIRFLISFCTCDSFFHFPQNHIQMLIISLRNTRKTIGINSGMLLRSEVTKTLKHSIPVFSNLHEGVPLTLGPHDIWRTPSRLWIGEWDPMVPPWCRDGRYGTSNYKVLFCCWAVDC